MKLLSLTLTAFLAPGLAIASPTFETLVSTRRITALALRGTRVLVGTTGGLVEWNPATGTRNVFLKGIPIRGLAQGEGAPGELPRTVIASDAGSYRWRPGGPERFDPDPAQSALVEPSCLLTGHPAGEIRQRRGEDLRVMQVPTTSPIHSMVRDRGDLLVASVEGIWRQVGDQFVREILPGGALGRCVTRLKNIDGRLLAGTPSGVFESPNPGHWRRVETGPKIFVTEFTNSPQGPVVATAGDGLVRLGVAGSAPIQAVTGESWLDPQQPPPDLSHVTAALWFQGSLLVGTRDEGLWILETPIRRAWSLEHEPPGNTITSLAHADHFGTLVVGTFEQGVGLLQKGLWRHFQEGQAHLTSSWVNQVASDGRRVLVRFSNGQVYTQIGRERFRQLGAGDGWPKNWTSAAGSSQGQLWAGTQNAFYLRTPEGWQIRAPKPQLQEKLILDLEVDGSVRWLATHRQGLLRWDTEGDDWNQYSLGSGLDDTWVTCLARFRGEIWAGTFSGGLARLPVGERDPRAWRRIRHDDPKGLLPSDGIQCLLETPHGLWIGTFEGLVWTDGEYWKTFGLETGLPSKNILSLTTGDGRLWVGTDSGLARANLEDLR